ncbi:MAG: hypothetical protein Kow0080_25920 [Candidatus Promineifilaceae bacterium]
MDKLGKLAPGPENTPKPAWQALNELQTKLPHRESWAERVSRVFFTPQRRWATAVTLFITLFALAFTFPGFRAAASDFLGLFRVQKFAAISISPDQIAILEEIAEKGLTPGNIEITKEPGEPQLVDSLDIAEKETGVTAVYTLPALGRPQAVYVSKGGSGTFHIDLEGARAILAAAGLSPDLLPDTLKDGRVMITVFNAIEQQFEDGYTLLQTESPIVTYPDGIDPTALGTALLQLLGMESIQAERVAANIDWTSTLLLPVPQEIASFNEVTIRGSSGLALTSQNGNGAALIWQENGYVFLLIGEDSTTAELVSLTETMNSD